MGKIISFSAFSNKAKELLLVTLDEGNFMSSPAPESYTTQILQKELVDCGTMDWYQDKDNRIIYVTTKMPKDYPELGICWQQIGSKKEE